MRDVILGVPIGAIFGLGLGVSGMTLPSKVIGFLDFAGQWDPSLAFVMVGAILVHAVALRVIARARPPGFALPTRTDIDLPLVGGAAMFGVGWGLGGFCPGPALVSLATFGAPALLFVLAMVAGMLLRHAHEARPEPVDSAPDSTPRPQTGDA